MKKYINEIGEFYNGKSIIIPEKTISNPTDEEFILAGYKKVENKWIKDDLEYDGNGIVIPSKLILNPTEDILLTNGWSIAPSPTEEELLIQAKINKIAEIDNYDSSSEVNSFSIGQLNMWLTFEERSRILASLLAYKASNAETMVKYFDGIRYLFTISLWEQMFAALEIYASEALNTTEAHKAAVNNLTTIQEVENYDYTLNYPTKLSFNI